MNNIHFEECTLCYVIVCSWVRCNHWRSLFTFRFFKIFVDPTWDTHIHFMFGNDALRRMYVLKAEQVPYINHFSLTSITSSFLDRSFAFLIILYAFPYDRFSGRLYLLCLQTAKLYMSWWFLKYWVSVLWPKLLTNFLHPEPFVNFLCDFKEGRIEGKYKCSCTKSFLCIQQF